MYPVFFFIFSLEICIFRLRICIFRLKICISSLRINFALSVRYVWGIMLRLSIPCLLMDVHCLPPPCVSWRGYCMCDATGLHPRSMADDSLHFGSFIHGFDAKWLGKAYLYNLFLLKTIVLTHSATLNWRNIFSFMIYFIILPMKRRFIIYKWNIHWNRIHCL